MQPKRARKTAAAFPAGTYGVTLGNSVHANWQGTLTVTLSNNTYTATYQHGRGSAKNVTFTYGTNASNQNWIAFSEGTVNFQQATQTTANGAYSGNVTGLPSAKDDPNDTWTATVQTK